MRLISYEAISPVSDSTISTEYEIPFSNPAAVDKVFSARSFVSLWNVLSAITNTFSLTN